MQDITEVTVGPADLTEVIFDGTVIVVTGTAGRTRVTFVGDQRATRELLDAVNESGQEQTALVERPQILRVQPVADEPRSTRQDGWFMCRSGGRSMQHFTIDGGHHAVCNKRFSARYAPLNDGTGWGFEITAEVDPETTIFTLCPRCTVKREAL